MTEDQFMKMIKTTNAKKVLRNLAKIPSKERRAFAKVTMALFKKLDRYWLSDSKDPPPTVKDWEAVTIAMLATASATEIKQLAFFPRAEKIPLEDVVRALQPDWVQPVVNHFVETRTFYVDRFRPLWRAGLCDRPSSDAVILHYYSRWAGSFIGEDEKDLLSGDVWRFFEVEGGGEDSLANHDKYLKKGKIGWAERLLAYAEEGTLDRQRLLDASLDALERDFGQYRAGWYSRFHVLMTPSVEELAARSDRYLRLLSSSVPPTVSFALKQVQVLDKAGVLDTGDLIEALEPALQARAKGTVKASLKLLESAVRRQPEAGPVAASKAVLALISEDADVQALALEIIEALGADPVANDLEKYIDLVAPSVRPRIGKLTGATVNAPPETATAAPLPESEPLVPVASSADALAVFLSVLEDPRDPFEVERAIDGVSRFGAALREDKTALSPLRKRAKQICAAPGESEVRFVLALTGRALAEGVDLKAVFKVESRGRDDFASVLPLGLQEAHLNRNIALLARVDRGVSLPMLSLPSDTSGEVSGTDLLSRMSLYRAAGVDPDMNDLGFALMRLNIEDGTACDLPIDSEAERAIAYAFGNDVPVGPTAEIWAAAWMARNAGTADAAIMELFKSATTNCGMPAEMSLQVGRRESGPYYWIDVSIPISPENEIKSRALPALFGNRIRRHLDAACCGSTYADVAWASIARPADPEPFFRIGLLVQETWQKLADNPTRAYLEPFFRKGGKSGPLGAAILAYYMACEDKSVSSLAVDATVAMVAQDRLNADQFADALRRFLMSHCLPTGRWTKAMKSVADLGAGDFVRNVLVRILDFQPEDTPRDLGGLLELLYELHVAHGAHFDDASARACLEAIQGGGKVARFRSSLLALSTQSAQSGSIPV